MKDSKPISEAKAKDTAKELDFNGSVEQLRRGMEVEQEHGPNGPSNGDFDITEGDTKEEASIAAAHIKEIPDYYDRLRDMESSAKKEGTVANKLASAILRRANEKLLEIISK